VVVHVPREAELGGHDVGRSEGQDAHRYLGIHQALEHLAQRTVAADRDDQVEALLERTQAREGVPRRLGEKELGRHPALLEAGDHLVRRLDALSPPGDRVAHHERAPVGLRVDIHGLGGGQHSGQGPVA